MTIEQFLEIHLRDSALYNVRTESALPTCNEDIYPYWVNLPDPEEVLEF